MADTKEGLDEELEPHGTGDSKTDWKAKICKWGRLAKQNVDKANKFDEVEEAVNFAYAGMIIKARMRLFRKLG